MQRFWKAQTTDPILIVILLIGASENTKTPHFYVQRTWTNNAFCLRNFKHFDHYLITWQKIPFLTWYCCHLHYLRLGETALNKLALLYSSRSSLVKNVCVCAHVCFCPAGVTLQREQDSPLPVPLVILPYMKHGDLRRFLIDTRYGDIPMVSGSQHMHVHQWGLLQCQHMLT